LLGGNADAARAHGIGHRAHGTASGGARPVDAHDVADEVPVTGMIGDDDWEFDAEPQPDRRLGVDPLIARLGALAVIVTLAAPLVVGFASSPSDSGAADSVLATIASAPTDAELPTEAPATTPAVSAPMAETTPVTPPVAAGATAEPTDDAEAVVSSESEVATLEVAADPDPLSEAPVSAAPASTAPVATEPTCGNRYELGAGDYWIRIADASGVSLADLLAVNSASVDTVLVPGRSICLPAGASTPTPPPTTPAPTAAPTTSRPATSVAPSRPTATTPPRTTPPPTTAPPAPTTTAPARPPAVPESQAVAIIREVWPDELEERAIEIAWRESNHRSNVNNSCCYGLFQIHWNAHRSWLAAIGVTSASQLYDPVVNTNAAYLLYQRSGGFGPWGG
jgi:hypothetical protein